MKKESNFLEKQAKEKEKLNIFKIVASAPNVEEKQLQNQEKKKMKPTESKLLKFYPVENGMEKFMDTAL